jgi:sugar lactone lactonase YvrE
VPADTVGPLAVDAERQRLYAADARYGHIYEVGLRSRGTKRVFDSGGDVRALVWHSAKRRLFAADADKSRIWVIDPQQPEGKPPSITGPYRQPSGVALSPDGSVWVADQRQSRIYRITEEGKVAVSFGCGSRFRSSL